MDAVLVIPVLPNKAGSLPVFRVFDEQGHDIGLYEAYDEQDAIALAVGASA